MTRQDQNTVIGWRPPEGPRVLAGRYRLGPALGRGGGGTVHRAHDTLADRAVAVKILKGGADRDRAREQREAAALRILDLPGAAKLLDLGQEGDTRFFVMELIEGRHFPSDGPIPWATLRETWLGVLETVARVHARGLVHRDLKPANVLVDEDGRPTIVDFGLSAGPALGERITATGAMVGTPLWFSPEQAAGRRADARSDLYAVGLLAYVALSGVMPHERDDVLPFLTARAERPCEPLASVAADVPAKVAAVVDALLQCSPDARPQTAAEALGLLRGMSETIVRGRPRGELPFLGDPSLLDAVVQAGRSGRSLRVRGGPGMGKTRLLREVRERLTAAGVEATELRAGRRPFSALAGLFPGSGSGESVDRPLDQMLALAVDAVRERLSGGAVLLVDHHPRLDRWSEQVLDEARGAGSVLRVLADGPADLELKPLAASALVPLFHGPERLLHLPSDCAAELHRRTDGVPRRVAQELRAWVRAGLAEEGDGRVRVSRSAVDRLRTGVFVGPPVGGSGVRTAGIDPSLQPLLAVLELAWPHSTLDVILEAMEEPRWLVEAQVGELEAAQAVRRRPDGTFEPLSGGAARALLPAARTLRVHRILARVLPRDSLHRLLHLSAAADPGPLAEGAVALGRLAMRAGRLGEAEGALGLALDAARAANRGDLETDLLVEITALAVEQRFAAALRTALHQLERAPCDGADLALRDGLRGLTREWLSALLRGARRPDPVPVPPFDDRRLELARMAVAARRGRDRSDEEARATLAQLDGVIATWDDPDATAALLEWRGNHRYRLLRFAEAAGLHQRAASTTSKPTGRVSALLSAASARMEAAQYDLAQELAAIGASEAAALRHPLHEARAVWIGRHARLRAGAPLDADPELPDLVAQLGTPTLLGLVLLTEASLARGQGRLDDAIALGSRGAAAWREAGNVDAEWTLRALVADCAGEVPEDLEAAWRVVEATRNSEAAAQIVALLLGAGVAPTPDAAARLHAAVDAYSGPAHAHAGVLRWAEIAERAAAVPRAHTR